MAFNGMDRFRVSCGWYPGVRTETWQPPTVDRMVYVEPDCSHTVAVFLLVHLRPSSPSRKFPCGGYAPTLSRSQPRVKELPGISL
jgi:hypothetical protein